MDHLSDFDLCADDLFDSFDLEVEAAFEDDDSEGGATSAILSLSCDTFAFGKALDLGWRNMGRGRRSPSGRARKLVPR